MNKQTFTYATKIWEKVLFRHVCSWTSHWTWYLLSHPTCSIILWCMDAATVHMVGPMSLLCYMLTCCSILKWIRSCIFWYNTCCQMKGALPDSFCFLPLVGFLSLCSVLLLPSNQSPSCFWECINDKYYISWFLWVRNLGRAQPSRSGLESCAFAIRCWLELEKGYPGICLTFCSLGTFLWAAEGFPQNITQGQEMCTGQSRCLLVCSR